MPAAMRILVVTRSYPADGDLYQYPFVHRRVVAYRAAGHEVAVFRPGSEPEPQRYSFDGVDWTAGDPAALAKFVSRWGPDVIAAHGFTESMWDALSPVAGRVPVRAWLHGSEIPEFFRQKAVRIADATAREEAVSGVERRRHFWAAFLPAMPERFGLVFVSHSAVDLARIDWGGALKAGSYSVVPNPIDTDLFAYREKQESDRFSILSIRPFDNWTYGNDMTVKAIQRLAIRPGFARLRFTIIGDGPLFEETLMPLRRFPTVSIRRRFLTQQEIVAEHAGNGIFLVPTRLDTHGVSRDEAMASGLVPVTNHVSAVPEFVDATCAALALPDDAAGLADAVTEMIEDPRLFLARSGAAAERVRSTTGHLIVIPRELALLEAAANA